LTSQVMTKLTVALLAAIFCIILADVSGEQSTETDILPEKLSDKNLVKREADPAKKKKKKTGKKKCQRGKNGRKCRREKKRKSGKKSKKRGGKSQGGKKGGKRRAKKRRTNGKKKCPKGKKGENCRNTKKQSRKMKIRKRKEGKNKGRKTKAARQALPTCFEKMYKYTSKMKKANNIQKQFARVNGSKSTIKGKKDKKGTFNDTVNTLTAALGGNKTNPKCAASSSRAFNATLDTLDKCSSDIEAACTFSVNDTRLAELEQCSKDAKSFFDAVDKCQANGNKNNTAACTCFDGLELDDLLAKVTACDVSKENNAVKEEKKKCKKSFGACKTEQINSIPFVDTCKEVLKCGGVSSKEEAEKQLKALTPLSDALKQTGFADAMKKLGLDSGTGSDGVLPSRRANMRVNRQAGSDSDGCNNVLANWKRFNTSGDVGVPGTDGPIDEKNIDATVDTLNTLNNSPTLEDDLKGCQKETARQTTVVLVIVQIRFYVFWCGWFQVTVVEIKITIITITFGITGTTAAPPVVSTVPPAGRNLKKFFGKNLIA